MNPTSLPQGSPISQLVDKLAGYLTPQAAYGQSYDQYAAPQMEAFNQFAQGIYRPEFERFTLNPFRRSYGDQAAGMGLNMMGNFQRNYNDRLAQVNQGYYDTLNQYKTPYEQFVRQGYEDQLRNYYNSPTAFTNY